MHILTEVIPQHTIDILAKGLYREALQYGFAQKDILRLVNSLLKLSMTPPQQPPETNTDIAPIKEQLTPCEDV